MIEMLRTDPKQRAENLMIVDLLRNDLSRVARPAASRCRAVRGRDLSDRPADDLDRDRRRSTDGLDAIDLLDAIYPCGSITGAPKIRAMEIIAELETAPRGVYTGCDRKACARRRSSDSMSPSGR